MSCPTTLIMKGLFPSLDIHSATFLATPPLTYWTWRCNIQSFNLWKTHAYNLSDKSNSNQPKIPKTKDQNNHPLKTINPTLQGKNPSEGYLSGSGGSRNRMSRRGGMDVQHHSPNNHRSWIPRVRFLPAEWILRPEGEELHHGEKKKGLIRREERPWIIFTG